MRNNKIIDPPSQGNHTAQEAVSTLLPTQSLPPCAGGGLLHCRTLVLFPRPPHVIEHALHLFHRPHFPFTVPMKNRTRLCM